MSTDVKTLVLIDSEKLKNLQNNLKSFYELHEKYEEAKAKLETNQKKDQESKYVGGGEPYTSSASKDTLENQENMSRNLAKIEQELKPNPSNQNIESESYEIL